MSFWKSRTGSQITGLPKDAFVRPANIPDNTHAKAFIKKFEKVSRDATTYMEATEYFEITYKIISDDFKNREVRQKIRCFDGKDISIDRALNMLKLVFDLCGFKPTHGGEPAQSELAQCVNKTVGIVIREWAKHDDNGALLNDGNYISEVHSLDGFVSKVGVKSEPVKPSPAQPTHEPTVPGMPPVESAFSRKASQREELDDDIPF